MPEKFKPFISSDRVFDISLDVSKIIDEGKRHTSKPSVSLKKTNLSITGLSSQTHERSKSNSIGDLTLWKRC